MAIITSSFYRLPSSSLIRTIYPKEEASADKKGKRKRHLKSAS
jgi:hypothetical protein